MYTFLIILMLLTSFLLALVILAQNPKGGGISGQFGAGGAANLMGVKRTGDLLEKLTWGFAIALMVFALGTHMLGQGDGSVQSINQQRAQQNRRAAPAQTAPAPATGTPAGTAPATTPAPATQPAKTPAP